MEEYGHLPYFGPPDPTRCPIHKKLFLGGLLFPPLWIVGAFLPVRDALDNCTYLSSSTRAGLLTNCRGGTFQISLSSHGHGYICHWLRITSTRNCVSGCLSINPSTVGGTTHIPNPTPYAHLRLLPNYLYILVYCIDTVLPMSEHALLYLPMHLSSQLPSLVPKARGGES